MTPDRGWCDRLYAAAESGEARIPWDKAEPHSLLADRLDDGHSGNAELTGSPGPAGSTEHAGPADGTGRRAVVVGCGLGRDAEYLARQGFDVTAFDVSAFAIREIRRRLPDSPVTYAEADVLDLPPAWARSFDLVVESSTVQSLPDTEARATAVEAIGGLVAPGGTLLVIAAAAGSLLHDPPPWPLTRSEVESFAANGLRVVRIEAVPFAEAPDRHRWRAEFTR